MMEEDIPQNEENPQKEETPEKEETPTPEKEINPLSEAENIKNLIQNSEKSKVVEFICKLSNEQRQKFKEIYLSSFGTELNKELDSLLSGDVKN